MMMIEIVGILVAKCCLGATGCCKPYRTLAFGLRKERNGFNWHQLQVYFFAFLQNFSDFQWHMIRSSLNEASNL